MQRRAVVWRSSGRRVAVAVFGGCLTVGVGCADGVLQVWTTRGADSQTEPNGAETGRDETNPPAAATGSETATSSGVDATAVSGSGDAPASAETVSHETASPAVPLLVDDFEDGDTRAASGLGWWYTQSDTTGEQTFQIETSGDAELGAFSAHYSGFGFQVWGAMLGLDFTPGEGHMDASNYGVLHFRARLGEGSVTQVSARLLDPDGQYSRELELTSEWREYDLSFAELGAVDGSERSLDASRLTQFHLFIFSADYFDLWLDDFVFR